MNQWLLSILVNNHFGVLTRITALFGRRGYNITALSVGETHDPALSRITIQTQADGAGARQILRQLQKLEDVKKAALLPVAESVIRELILVKLTVPQARREELWKALSSFSVDLTYQDETNLIVSYTGCPDNCAAFLKALSPFTLKELCRTGVTAVSTLSTLYNGTDV